jgi:Transposase, Mutator family
MLPASLNFSHPAIESNPTFSTIGPQVAAKARSRRQQPGRSRRPALHLPRLPPSQWRSARTANAIERIHEEIKRRIKTQTVLPSADTAALLFRALLASGQTNIRKIDGRQISPQNPSIANLISPHNMVE